MGGRGVVNHTLLFLPKEAYILKATQSAESAFSVCVKSAYIATTKLCDKSGIFVENIVCFNVFIDNLLQ